MYQLRYVLFIFSLFYLFGPTSYSDKTLAPYKERIITFIEKKCKSNQYFHPKKQFLYFTKFNDDKIGECIITPWFYTIIIDKEFWNMSTEDQRLQLIIHETTHCALVLDHVDNKFNYMYYMFNDLPLPLVKEQLLENVKYRCGE